VKEPVDHILRPSLPWRSDAAITECGYDATKVKTLTRDDLKQRLKDMGQQRTAMLTCMTCLNTAQRHGAWEDDPRSAVEREITWEGKGRWAHKDRGIRLRDELLSIAALIAAHPDEFQAHIEATGQRREWLAKKAAMAHAAPARKQ
jgi:hypothetical protein